MLKSKKFLLGFSVSLVFLLLFLFRVDVDEVTTALKEAHYLWLIPAVLIYFVSMFARTVRWRYLLSPLRMMTHRRLWPVMIVGYTANNLLPVRLGELVRVQYLREREPVSRASALATIAVERVFDGLTLLFFAAGVSLALPVGGLLKDLADDSGIPLPVLALVPSVPFFLAIGLLLTMSAKPIWLLNSVSRMLRLLPYGLRPGAYRLAESFLDGLAILRSRRRLPLIFMLSLPIWLLEVLMYYIVTISFNVPEHFSGVGEMIAVMLLVTAISNLATSIPSSQGGVGPFEFFGAATLVILGLERAIASAYIIVLHLALLAPLTLLGLLYLWADGISLGYLSRQRGEASLASDPAPSPISTEAEGQ